MSTGLARASQPHSGTVSTCTRSALRLSAGAQRRLTGMTWRKSWKYWPRLGAQPDRGQYFQDFLQVMPVNLLCAPAESLKALLVHVETVPECGWLALAKPVDIHHSDEIVQLINAAERSSFPDPALGALTISHQNIGAVIQLVESRAQRHAHAGAQSLSEGASRHVHERQARCGMAFEVAAELAKLEQFLRREKPRLGLGRIEQRRRMTLGKNEPVVVVIMRVLRVKAHVPEE